MHKEGLPKQSLFVSATNETMKSLVGYPMTYTPRLCILLSRDGGNATKIKNMEELEMSTVLSRQDIINIIYSRLFKNSALFLSRSAALCTAAPK